MQLSIAALQAAPKSLRKKLPYKNDRGRIASARVLFGNEPIAKWELAVCPGQTVESLKPGEVHAYGVDSGSGAFIDQLVLTKAGTSLSDPSLQKRMYKSMGPVQGLGNAALFEFSPNQNIAIFDTFDGDGAYATYWGLNKRGRAVCLATNFFGVPEEDA